MGTAHPTGFPTYVLLAWVANLGCLDLNPWAVRRWDRGRAAGSPGIRRSRSERGGWRWSSGGCCPRDADCRVARRPRCRDVPVGRLAAPPGNSIEERDRLLAMLKKRMEEWLGGEDSKRYFFVDRTLGLPDGRGTIFDVLDRAVAGRGLP